MTRIAARSRLSVAGPTTKKARTRPGIRHRDREETRKRILAAMGRLLARKGSKSLGINAIAREAKVDKVLIYRYFGGLQPLYRAFALEGDSFPSFEEITEGRHEELKTLQQDEAVKAVLLGFGRSVRRRPLTKEIMRWELLERNELTDALAEQRERQSEQWLSMAPDTHGADLPAVASILAAGQVYLALRAKTADSYNGINLRSEKGWQRIEEAVALLSDLFFQHVRARDQEGNSRRDTASERVTRP